MIHFLGKTLNYKATILTGGCMTLLKEPPQNLLARNGENPTIL
jgi:hypothetical protein